MDVVIHAILEPTPQGQLKFWESQKLYVNFQLRGVYMPLHCSKVNCI